MSKPALLPGEARALVLERSGQGAPESVPLESAAGRVLAAPVAAPMNLPPFPQSAMDGYAFAGLTPAGAQPGDRFRLVGMARAGGELPLALKSGECVRIFTGGPVPEGATGILIQEIATVEGSEVVATGAAPAGPYLRAIGSDVSLGAEALPAGTPLSPSALAFLRALGIARVEVHAAPRVSLVASGDELCTDAGARGVTQVLESSSLALRADLAMLGLPLDGPHFAPDTREAHRAVIAGALARSDVLMVTGGISVGDYDLVKEVLGDLGVQPVFWRVRQRPGGPLYFGALGDKLVFGLPGNPASSLVCYYQYVRPCLRRMLGHANPRLPRITATLESDFRKTSGKTHFVRAFLRREGASVLASLDRQQDSHTLRSFARSHALAIFPAELDHFPAGVSVDCDLLPGHGALES